MQLIFVRIIKLVTRKSEREFKRGIAMPFAVVSNTSRLPDILSNKSAKWFERTKGSQSAAGGGQSRSRGREREGPACNKYLDESTI